MESNCTIWDRSISNAGYGLAYSPEDKKTVLAHRWIFNRHYGYYPKVVMHTCDNPLCVNPEHLKAGTQSDNIKDCISKGRYISRQKLSLKDCQDIQNNPLSSRKLASIYGVNQKTICNIKNNKYSYSDITGHGGSCGV